MSNFSRRRIAKSISKMILSGEDVKSVMQKLASYLVVRRQTKFAHIFVKEIENFLAENGHLIVDITTATKVNNGNMEKLLKEALHSEQTNLYIRNHLDKSIIGGLLIETPTSYLNETVSYRLKKLRSS